MEDQQPEHYLTSNWTTKEIMDYEKKQPSARIALPAFTLSRFIFLIFTIKWSWWMVWYVALTGTIAPSPSAHIFLPDPITRAPRPSAPGSGAFPLSLTSMHPICKGWLACVRQAQKATCHSARVEDEEQRFPSYMVGRGLRHGTARSLCRCQCRGPAPPF
jgi:hypothetical protein